MDRRAARATSAANRRVLIGAVLLVLTVLVWVARTFAADGGSHSWDPRAEPPAAVHLTQGKQYEVSTPGGGQELIARQTSTQPQVTCSLTQSGTAIPTQVSVGVSDPRITHVIGTFVSPVSGQVALRCTGTGAVFVDDADDAAFDTATGLVLLCGVLAVFGVGFLLSGLTGRPRRDRPRDEAGVAAHDVVA